MSLCDKSDKDFRIIAVEIDALAEKEPLCKRVESAFWSWVELVDDHAVDEEVLFDLHREELERVFWWELDAGEIHITLDEQVHLGEIFLLGNI